MMLSKKKLHTGHKGKKKFASLRVWTKTVSRGIPRKEDKKKNVCLEVEKG